MNKCAHKQEKEERKKDKAHVSFVRINTVNNGPNARPLGFIYIFADAVVCEVMVCWLI